MGGQVPHLDFHSSLGPLAFLLPAATMLVSDSYGMLHPVLSGICVIIFLPALLYVCINRFRPVITAAVSVYLLLMIILPLNPGDYKDFSIAVFYNRVCWSSLAVLFMFYMPGRRQGRLSMVAEGCIMGMLLVIMLYMKVTYFLVGLSFVFFLLMVKPGMRTGPVVALALTLASVIAVEAAYGINWAYMQDVYMSIRASSAIRGTLGYWATLVPFNIVGLGCLLGLAALSRDVTGLSTVDYMYYAFTVAASLMIIQQNAQSVELVALVGPAAVAAERVVSGGKGTQAYRAASLAALALLAVFIAKEVSVRSVGLAYYYMESAKYEAPEDMPAVLEGMYIRESKDGNVLKAHLEHKYGWADTFNQIRWSKPRHVLFQREYLMTILEGVRWLRQLGEPQARISVMDFSNPFSLVMGAPPPVGQNIWNHNDRNFGRRAFIAPAEAYGDTDIIMYPLYPVSMATRDLLMEIYGAYMEENFTLAGETSMWRIYLRAER